ncbi:MAG: lamin tail domain-containing protein, partial [Planctomycetota bacterium]
EVLAQNIDAVDHNGTRPDMIELYYDGPGSLSLADMSITDNPDNPRKFVFSGGTAMDPGDHLVLYADDYIWTPGIHLGSNLNADGEGVYLYDTTANGGGLIDSVEFGMQLPDLSIGRVADGQWRLTRPTLGQANIAQILGNPALLKVNEWFTEGDVFRNTDFIEIYNPQTVPVDMSTMYLTDEPVAEPNRHQIAPLSFVHAAGYAIFVADGDPEDGADHLDFRLSSDGEIIGLFDTDIKEVDQVIYFPQTTDVSEGLSPDGNDSYEFLEPPTTSVSNITTVVINEVLAHSHGTAPDWIELYNTTDANIDIGGWFLSDNSGNRTKYEIAPGTSITAHDYVVFYEDTDFNDPCDAGSLVQFALSENGEMVCLSSGTGGTLTGYYKQQDFAASATGVSFGRHLKSTGLYDFVSMDSNTPGSDNAYPKVGPVVINEIMYHPDPNGDAEYIELYNITNASVNLYDGFGNTWQFTEGIDLAFPLDVNIPAHGYVVVVQNISEFNAEYPGAPGSVQIFQWDSGKLDNGGENVQISMPGDIDAVGERHFICVDSVRYDDSAPWPIEPDGDGYSLTRTDPNLYGNDPNNWQAALPSPGE